MKSHFTFLRFDEIVFDCSSNLLKVWLTKLNRFSTHFKLYFATSKRLRAHCHRIFKKWVKVYLQVSKINDTQSWSHVRRRLSPKSFLALLILTVKRSLDYCCSTTSRHRLLFAFTERRFTIEPVWKVGKQERHHVWSFLRTANLDHPVAMF